MGLQKPESDDTQKRGYTDYQRGNGLPRQMLTFTRRGLTRVVVENTQLHRSKATTFAIEASPEESEVCGLQCGIERL